MSTPMAGRLNSAGSVLSSGIAYENSPEMMNITRKVSDFRFGVTHGLINHRLGGHRSETLGRMRVVESGRAHAVDPEQFPEVTIAVSDATVVFPNIVIDQNQRLIDSNNGYRSLELMDHNLAGYPLRRADAGIDVDLPPKSVELPECAYMVAAGNYSAFLLGELPRLEPYAPFMAADIPLVVHGDLKPFHRQLLELAGIDPAAVLSIPADTALRVGRLIHATPTYLHNCTSYYALDFLRATLTPRLDVDRDGERIYLSRSGLGPDSERRIANEIDLEAFLASRGFRIVHPQEILPREQLELFATASIIIAPFGAAWASAVFRKAGAKSLMLVTKLASEFPQIFQYLGGDLSVIRLAGDRPREDTNFARHIYTVTDKDLELISSFLDSD